ncbi:hypothetical protein O6H91_06G035300 [Diphasiastrum complanatum]|uniref:Uncharacterized protein n=1 Tax=Diphasiastrum complanatum TaxID=34168 RepID=A0ACC2DCA9_DIPCM|nr:hypothetical protein O6H91_06G035300 [Diphasiastrum complanatum]
MVLCRELTLLKENWQRQKISLGQVTWRNYSKSQQEAKAPRNLIRNLRQSTENSRRINPLAKQRTNLRLRKISKMTLTMTAMLRSYLQKISRQKQRKSSMLNFKQLLQKRWSLSRKRTKKSRRRYWIPSSKHYF